MEEYEVRDSYFRIQHSQLEILNWYLELRPEHDDSPRETKLTFRAFVKNIGKTVENQYKLNVDFEGDYLLDLHFENYVPNLKAIGTPTGYRLAEPSSLPLYPDEVIEFDRFTITLPSIKQKEIFENTTVSLELYFGQHGKCSEKKTRISDLIQYK